ncbi:hypothetical protein [Tenacibaculum sp. SZ-18]|uniref:hypothetical protein n=1 Tax=Tenacibaculum sp. SZ-18 TaxID=754423 RepID=UPI0012FDFD0D|nr:hypothetical protein [Tenacibaculum sp. SZ-18]
MDIIFLKLFLTIKKLQTQHQEMLLLFTSIEDNIDDLKAGIQKYNIEGKYYLLSEKWDTDFI